jgi:GR25 family glycosyltransferase involved in LPS biosynthesis
MNIQNIYYINLEHRKDRKKHMIKQLKQLNWNGTRISAVQTPNGAIGCTLSHLKCLQMAINLNLDYIVILEDDICFLNPPLFIQQLQKTLNTLTSWDVILFAGNNANTYTVINDSCVKIKNTQTTTGYMVNKHYFQILLDNIKEGLSLLIKQPHLHVMYAIDKYWFLLQEKDNWYFVTPLTVVQMESYSDIEKRNTNYGRMMLMLDKPYFKHNSLML